MHESQAVAAYDTDGTANDPERHFVSPDKIALAQFVPPPELAPFVTQIYFFRCEEQRVHDLQPAALGHLVFLLKGKGSLRFQDGHVDQLAAASVVGPGMAAAEFDLAGPVHDLGFALSPFGFVALTGRPANQFTDRAVPASELFGPEVDALAAQFVARHADGGMRIAHMVEAVAALLLRHIRPLPSSHMLMVRTVIDWLSSNLDPDVDVLYTQLDMSRSTAARLITKYFGAAPKPLMRKYRALRAASLLIDPASTPELRAKIDSLFYDQPHMIREIRQFAGRTPGALDGDDAKLLRIWLSKDNYRDIETFPG